MRIIFVVLVLALGACSSGGHSAGGPNGHSLSSVPTPAATGPAFGSPRATAPVTTPPPDDEPGEEAPERPEAHKVTFALRGSGRVSVSFTTPDGHHRRMVVSPPWSRTFTVNDGQSVDVNAHGKGSGELTCTLSVDGELVKSASSSGGSASVDCGDSLGF
ncbi:hypothetical protein OG417_38870 [Actinoallomurus sp. NBC_01490]|uniref:hypothetical protein n=1 Tax=Actinoallomurus sp. NBC_01490 TaxID=2903557 RepID=UPI002E31D16C|nr:hypothetical protein [Actinoallomurus sp. NBC_01490]